MRTNIVLLAAVLCSFSAQAFQGFIENPYTPYPPGCATLPELQRTLFDHMVVNNSYPDGGRPVSVFEQTGSEQQTIALVNALNPAEKLDATVEVRRISCADSDRSVLWLVFYIPADTDHTARFWLPEVRADLGGNVYVPMSLSREPNGWGLGTTAHFEIQTFGGVADYEDGHLKAWFFVLDNLSPLGPYFSVSSLMSPAQYNGAFNLELKAGGDWADGTYVFEAPPNMAAYTPVPLSGRLSGNWVADGAADQGFMISISELVPDAVPAPEQLLNSQLLMFLSWFTFDADGDMLWLTGAQRFSVGSRSVSIPIEKVTHGEFLGNKTADREVVGNVSVSSSNCNELNITYDLTNLGLGAGSQTLHRPYSLETAGYTCRDLEARIQAK